MNVEKFIRILGYIVYSLLWSPIVVLGLIILPFVCIIIFKSIKDGLKMYMRLLKLNIKHDITFIETGVWY